ncbi:DUF4910 domain-containing protein [Myxococcus sp. K15C18031901]|uniref:DUF4910 domain-containing protein n=1 Tax=Myxococcus dinghuensis TaxID=2906761 RepID=UPI0020A75AE8|nr:DUF4910 domain-containing protein [Myxococcus dinghuensis]MCP3102422.1 DUF4910 domain-containing protein [Myxococcus dinghuensis]
MVRERVSRLLRDLPIDDVMGHLARVAEHDRYQASRGIGDAAGEVADIARRLGLSDVTLSRFPADGAARWWSFRAPVSWTPVVARLEVWAEGRSVLQVDHALQPFSVATYSAPTPPGGLSARLVRVDGAPGDVDVRGAVAVVGRGALSRGDLAAELERLGALGFITDAPARTGVPGEEHPGRIELEPHSRLFAFSLTSRQLGAVRPVLDAGAEARVHLAVDRSATMPVVSAVLPGEQGAGEVWLTAHLCHPRPGANDNASGVAALLGVASLLRGARARSPAASIRFLWGPEFLGVAAFLHAHLASRGARGLPSAVINVDMAGEDQALCGSPFLLERGPDFRPSLLVPFAEEVVGEVFSQTASHPGAWQAIPFAGFSDHALFADPSTASPAVQLCHAPDRFNHSAADTLDKVSPLEMSRTTVAAAALAELMADPGALPAGQVEQLVQDWCSRELSMARQVARRFDAVEAGAWSQRLLRHVERTHSALRKPHVEAPRPPARGPVLRRRWDGPFNARAMAADLSAERRAELTRVIAADKQNLALLLNFAIRADGSRAREDVVDETSLALRRPIEEGVARRLVDLLLESGWVTEG